MEEKREISTETRLFGTEQIQVMFRKSASPDGPASRYPGFKQEIKTLPKGYVHRKGALPLSCDIIFARDVAIKLRDGITIYADIFRPAGDAKVPALIAWSPYGKAKGIHHLDDFPFRTGVPKKAVSELQAWEGPDPAYWCNHGYAVINADARGVFSSEGDVHFWGTQEGRDGYDLIEWIAMQEWSNGKTALTGNSWLAIAQWFIAAECPPHLAAIAPWEGFSDAYRNDMGRGGIVDPGYCGLNVARLCGRNRTEDIATMIEQYPLMNAYWEDKIAKLENIHIPAYVVASWTSGIHTHGTFESYRRISSQDKWLRVHNTMEWPDYYDPEYCEDLRRFFDRYLKEINNDWEQTPRVRLSILDAGGVDTINRPEKEFPLQRARYTKLYLDGSSGTLSQEPVRDASTVRYKADDDKGQASFVITFPEDTELTGYMKLRLWVEAAGSDDMDLYVKVEKLSKRAKVLSSSTITPPNPIVRSIINFLWDHGVGKFSFLFFTGPGGRLRASHRRLDEARSTPSEPYRQHRVEELLSPGQIVPVEIGLWPAGMRWRAGEQLRLLIMARNSSSLNIPGMKKPILRNKGEHIIHTGGEYDSHLLVPVIPGK